MLSLKRITMQDDGSIRYPEEEVLKEGWARLSGTYLTGHAIFSQRNMGFAILVNEENRTNLEPYVGQDLYLVSRDVPVMGSVGAILPIDNPNLLMQKEWRIEAPPDGKHIATGWGHGKPC